MTARLLPHKDLIALLCRYAHGESPSKLAEAYGIKIIQVTSLLGTHRDKLKDMTAFLGLPRRLPAKPGPKPEVIPGLWRKCNRCQKDFFTESRFVRSCDTCHHRADFKAGADHSTMSWRGAG